MDVMVFWGMCFQGAERPQSGDMGVRSRGRRTKSATAKKTTGSETNPSPPLPPPLSHRDTKSLKSLLPEVLLTGASSPKSSWHNNPVGTRAVEMHWPASGSTTYVTRKTKKACSFPSWKYLIWLHVIQTQSSLKVTLDSASVCFFPSIYRLRFCPSLPSFPFSSIQRSH